MHSRWQSFSLYEMFMSLCVHTFLDLTWMCIFSISEKVCYQLHVVQLFSVCSIVVRLFCCILNLLNLIQASHIYSFRFCFCAMIDKYKYNSINISASMYGCISCCEKVAIGYRYHRLSALIMSKKAKSPLMYLIILNKSADADHF